MGYCLWYLLIKNAETEVSHLNHFFLIITKNKSNNNIREGQLFFIVIFLNKYKLLGHYNASTALEVYKLRLYKAMCVCPCVCFCSTKSCVAVVREK